MDGGDFMTRMLDREEPKSVLTWKEMQRSQYDAVGLGEVEFGHWNLTKQLMQEHPLPIVSTNVEYLADGAWKPVGEKYRIVTVDGVKIGIVSVVSEELFSTLKKPEVENELRLLPPMAEIERTVNLLDPQVDMIVLLAHTDAKMLEQYASLQPKIDVVLGGHMTQNDEMPIQVANAIVNRSGTRGQTLSTTRLIVSPTGQIVDFGGKNVTLDPGYKEDPTVLAEVQQVMEAAKPKPPVSSGQPALNQRPPDLKVKEATGATGGQKADTPKREVEKKPGDKTEAHQD